MNRNYRMSRKGQIKPSSFVEDVETPGGGNVHIRCINGGTFSDGEYQNVTATINFGGRKSDEQYSSDTPMTIKEAWNDIMDELLNIIKYDKEFKSPDDFNILVSFEDLQQTNQDYAEIVKSLRKMYRLLSEVVNGEGSTAMSQIQSSDPAVRDAYRKAAELGDEHLAAYEELIIALGSEAPIG